MNIYSEIGEVYISIICVGVIHDFDDLNIATHKETHTYYYVNIPYM